MSSEFVSHQLQPPIYHIGKNVAVNNEKEEDQVDPKLGMKDQELIIKKSVTRGFVLSLMIAGLYIYQKVIRKHYKGHTPQTFFLLFLALTACNYLMHTFTPEFYKYVISGLGWGVGSVMFKYIIDI